jgi:hypothetical protein
MVHVVVSCGWTAPAFFFSGTHISVLAAADVDSSHPSLLPFQDQATGREKHQIDLEAQGKAAFGQEVGATTHLDKRSFLRKERTDTLAKMR